MPNPQLGSTTVGITTPHGTILAVEKRVPSPLLESSSIEKIMEVDSHIGCAMSGLTADARTMVDHARVTSQMHNFTYDEPIGVESCTQAVCDLALRFGESVEDDDALMVGRRCQRGGISAQEIICSHDHSGWRCSLLGSMRKGPNCESISTHNLVTRTMALMPPLSGIILILLAHLFDTTPKPSDQARMQHNRVCRMLSTR